MTSSPAAIASIVSAAAARSWSPWSSIEPSSVIVDRGPAIGAEVGQEARLVLEAALADDVELRVVAHRPLDQAGQRGPFELGQVLAGEVGDEVGGRVDRSAVDGLHGRTLPAGRVSSPVTRPPAPAKNA